MNPQKAIRIRYKETRFLEMLAEPWHGSGYLYAMTPNVMVKEQWRPNRELMAIQGTDMHYSDRASGKTKHGKLLSNDTRNLSISAFKALLTGDKTFLTKQYRVEFCTKPELWQITLLPKTSDSEPDISKIAMEGLPNQAAQKITIVQGDGDRTLITLKPDDQGSEIGRVIKEILTELEAK